jgi:glucose/arabinose dehydrogenase
MPWGLAFLPDRRMLITQKSGALLIVSADGSTKTNVTGVPAVTSGGGGNAIAFQNNQGGLLDVAIDPDFSTDPWIYLTYVEAGSGSTAGIAVGRGRLVGNALQNFTVLFRQLPKVSGPAHFGSRMVFRSDKTLFVTLGERMQYDSTYTSPPQSDTMQALGPQEPSSLLGKVIRINRNDGSAATGNPNLGVGAAPGVWSLGHRNPQGAAIHPTTGELWVTEHGPLGGDELNRVVAGGNYGWPLVSYGCRYNSPSVNPSCRIGGTNGSHGSLYREPVSFFGPTSIGPSSLIFYTGANFPEWKNNALFGAIADSKGLWRVALNGNAESAREAITLSGVTGERVRLVRQGPDDWLYVLTDSGKLILIDR